MGTATLTQMNVRIDAALKDRGDEALASIGFTPTQAVRALWGYASKRGEQLDEVRRFLEKAEAGESASRDAVQVLQDGWRIVPDGLASLGISEESLSRVARDDAVLRDGALLDRAAKKGWL